MYGLFDILETSGFIALEDSDKISGLPTKRLEKLYCDLYSSIFSAQTARNPNSQTSQLGDTFSFHAGASIRTASGCGSPGCRIKKLDFLSRYAALYATALTYPFSIWAPHRADHP